jgi:ribonuclease BN (tRNA processing enzyme)
MLEIGSEAIVLDLGQGALSSLIPHRDPATVLAVFVSHMHGDHHVDLIPLRNMLYYHYGEPRSIGLYAPAGLRARYELFLDEPGFLDNLVGPDLSEGVHSMGPFTVQAHPVTHSESSHAFRVTDTHEPDGPGLVYSGDCGRAEDLLPLIHKGDTVLCEAFWSTREPIASAHHLNAMQAADVAYRGGASHLILTHILEAYDPAAALPKAQAIFPGPVLLAEPELVVHIGGDR